MRCVWRIICSRSSCSKPLSPACTNIINTNFRHDICNYSTLCRPTLNSNGNPAISNLFKAYFSSTSTDDNQSSSKLFQEIENESFHEYMSNNDNYKNTIHQYGKKTDELISKDEFERIIAVEKWDDKSVDEFYSSFVKVANYASNVLHEPISNSKYTALSLGLKNHCERFRLEQLIGILECLRFWPETQGTKAPNFKLAIQSLDHACMFRRQEWDTDTALKIIDLWFGLRLMKLSTFVKKVIGRLIEKPNRLSQYKVVQIFFYLNTLRALPAEISLFNMELELDECVDRLSVCEVGIVAIGFFKSQKKIHSNTLLNKMILKLLDNVENADIITTAAILKLIRYTAREDNIPLSMELIDRLLPKMDQFTLQTNLHILLLCVELHIDNYKCVSKFMEMFLADPKAARLKEMEKLALGIANFSYDSPLAKETSRTILSELKKTERREELALHGRAFIKCVCSLAASGLYDQQLIATVLNKRLLKEYYNSKYTMGSEVVALNNTVELEMPDYKGDMLDSKTASFIGRKYSLIDLSMKYRVKKDLWIILELLETVGQMCQPNCHTLKYILPHFNRPDMIVNVTDELKFKPVPQIVLDKENFSEIIKCPAGVRLLALVCGCRGMFTYGTNTLLGAYRKKLHQLTLIGYLPVLIPHYEWNNMNSNDKKIGYIQKKIEHAIKEDSSSEKTCESRV
ncbi:hypothetical protein LSTR_LSTR006409 [Laodelphax striatellus]|uniref:RAP domain-containing protein n=1 Tax=Laodelphax striatellus TaxID=195883 RepID=A0A482WY86_LAOST|nr:hypothetical protein LSTR_LSTR006409 [Laodelphax striatellus]